MINYVVKCIMDDDGIKMCVGKKGFEMSLARMK